MFSRIQYTLGCTRASTRVMTNTARFSTSIPQIKYPTKHALDTCPGIYSGIYPGMTTITRFGTRIPQNIHPTKHALGTYPGIYTGIYPGMTIITRYGTRIPHNIYPTKHTLHAPKIHSSGRKYKERSHSGMKIQRPLHFRPGWYPVGVNLVVSQSSYLIASSVVVAAVLTFTLLGPG